MRGVVVWLAAILCIAVIPISSILIQTPSSVPCQPRVSSWRGEVAFKKTVHLAGKLLRLRGAGPGASGLVGIMHLRKKGTKDRTKKEREARRRQEEFIDEAIDHAVQRGEFMEDPRMKTVDSDRNSEEGHGFLVDSSEPVEEEEGASLGQGAPSSLSQEGGQGSHAEENTARKGKTKTQAKETRRGRPNTEGKQSSRKGKGKQEDSGEQDPDDTDSPKKMKEGPKAPPKPRVMSLWREISGEVVHLYDWPGLNAGEDHNNLWYSDRHIFFVDENTTTFTPDHMVKFDEDDVFRSATYWDERYGREVCVSDLSRDLEIWNGGKAAVKRNETGDTITDHVISHYLMNLILDYRAVNVNISATNWSAPKGWRKYRTGYDEQPSWHWRPPHFSYAVWSSSKDSGVSRWVLYIDQKFGDFYIGALVEPVSNLTCAATKLRSDAWFINADGYAWATSKEGKKDLDQFVAAQVGLDCWPPYFATASIVWMELDRDRRTLQITVNSLPPFAFYNVDPKAVPFINVCFPDDGASLMTLDEAILRTPTNLRNDVMARWSVIDASIHRTPIVDEKDTRKTKKKEEIEHVSFWPGGRLKTHGDDVDKEYHAYAAWYPDEKEQAALAMAPAQMVVEPDV